MKKLLRKSLLLVAAVAFVSTVSPLCALSEAASYTIWPSTAVPSNPAVTDGQPIEVGVKFRADVSGDITGLRFYKGSDNTGIHVANLWSSSGTLLASATFTNETASGWQEVSFSTPVAISANTTYVASYHSSGYFALDLAYFTAGVDNPPLHALANGVDSGNGVYIYGASAFPTLSINANNYGVDVVFSTTALPVIITTPSLPDGVSNIPYSATLSANGGSPPYTWAIANGALPAGLSLNTGTGVISGTPTATGTFNFTVQAADLVNPQQAATKDMKITIAAQGGDYTIWPSTTVPAIPVWTNGQPIEVGVKFRTDVSGYITGLRFYKGSENTGTHVANLWSSSGTPLASATFTNETASGWQEVSFPTPVAISANTTYVASYHSSGYFALDLAYFTAGVDNPPLHALANGVDGGNGVYIYGDSAFPTQTYSNNYWVDVVFSTSTVDTIPPTVTAFTIPANVTGPTVPITSFTAVDNFRITGYLISESSDTPSAMDGRWSATVPTSYSFATSGSKILYAWAKDAAGNVSSSRNAAVTISIPLTGFISYTYDDLNRLRTTDLGNGVSVTYDYDEIGNIISRSASGNTTATIVAGTSAGGSINPGGTLIVTIGGSATYSITPANGYKVADVIVDGVSHGAITSYTFSNVTANHTITANFVSILMPDITTTFLPSGIVGTTYSQTLAATGGLAPYLWSINGSPLPAGLSLNSSTGTISGTPSTVGTSTVTVVVTDASGATASKVLSIVVYNTDIFVSRPLPWVWTTQGAVSVVNSTSHSAPNSLILGDGWSTDGSVSFVVPTAGYLFFWYAKSSEWGYYREEDDWYSVGTNVGSMTISINGAVVHTATADTGWTNTPPFSVQAGDTIRIAQVGNHDDGGVSCSNLLLGRCGSSGYDPYYNISVYIDDISISETPPPVTTAVPSGGTYSSAQSVTLSSDRPATIYYTTDGSTPTTSSAVYSGPLYIATSTTLNYFARDAAGSSETVKSQIYIINATTPDTGSIVMSTPGTYTHTFNSDCMVTLSYLKGAGGQGAYHDGSCPGNPGGWCNGLAGNSSSIIYDGTTRVTANGGGGGLGESNGADGTASNSIGGSNITGGGGAGGEEYSGYSQYGNGGNGGAVTGGSFAVTSGKVLTVVVGDINSDPSAGWDGVGGSVSISWH